MPLKSNTDGSFRGQENECPLVNIIMIKGNNIPKNCESLIRVEWDPCKRPCTLQFQSEAYPSIQPLDIPAQPKLGFDQVSEVSTLLYKHLREWKFSSLCLLFLRVKINQASDAQNSKVTMEFFTRLSVDCIFKLLNINIVPVVFAAATLDYDQRTLNREQSVIQQFIHKYDEFGGTKEYKDFEETFYRVSDNQDFESYSKRTPPGGAHNEIVEFFKQYSSKPYFEPNGHFFQIYMVKVEDRTTKLSRQSERKGNEEIKRWLVMSPASRLVALKTSFKLSKAQEELIQSEMMIE